MNLREFFDRIAGRCGDSSGTRRDVTEQSDARRDNDVRKMSIDRGKPQGPSTIYTSTENQSEDPALFPNVRRLSQSSEDNIRNILHGITMENMHRFEETALNDTPEGPQKKYTQENPRRSTRLKNRAVRVDDNKVNSQVRFPNCSEAPPFKRLKKRSADEISDYQPISNGSTTNVGEVVWKDISEQFTASDGLTSSTEMQPMDVSDNKSLGDLVIAVQHVTSSESDKMEETPYNAKPIQSLTTERYVSCSVPMQPFLGDTSDVHRTRIPVELFSAASEEIIDAELIADFHVFFNTDRDLWIVNRFFTSLYQRIIRPAIMLGSDSQANQCTTWLRLASCNRLSVNENPGPPNRNKCDGCHITHRYVKKVQL